MDLALHGRPAGNLDGMGRCAHAAASTMRRWREGVRRVVGEHQVAVSLTVTDSLLSLSPGGKGEGRPGESATANSRFITQGTPELPLRRSIHVELESILPAAIAWAVSESSRVAADGRELTSDEIEIARTVGVTGCKRIRIEMCEQLPVPQDKTLQMAAKKLGLLGSDMKGLTLGHSVIVCRGYLTRRTLAHEFRHVFQCEQAGSIEQFLRVYLAQVDTEGYDNAPLELDAVEAESMVL